MNTSNRRRLFQRLRNKEYRDSFVAQHSTIGLPFQIRAMRDDRGWTQRELGERAGMAQETISLLENPGYGRFTLRTLNRLASAFDVGILVRFVPFSRVVDEMTDISMEQLAVPDYEHDPGLHPAPGVDLDAPNNGHDNHHEFDNVVAFPGASRGILVGQVGQDVRVNMSMSRTSSGTLDLSHSDPESLRVVV